MSSVVTAVRAAKTRSPIDLRAETQRTDLLRGASCVELRFALSGQWRRGFAVAEMAAILSAVAVLLIAAADLDRLGRIGGSLTNAARRGAECVSPDPDAENDLDAIQAAVLAEAADLPNVTATNPAVTASTVTRDGKSYLAVTVTYDLTGASTCKLLKVGSMSRTVKVPIVE
jgi:hypothetical protein